MEHDHSRQRRRLGFFPLWDTAEGVHHRLDRITACVLIPAAVFALALGGHDAAQADDLGIRTIATGLAALGLIVGYAVIMRIMRGEEAEPIEMLACLVVAVISCYLMTAQLLGRHFGLFWPLVQIVVFLAALIGSLVSAGLLWNRQRRRGHEFKFGEFKLLGSAVSLGAVVGVLQFWYTNVYLPGSAEPSLSITPTIGTVSLRATTRSGPRLLVSARVDLDNTSGSRLEVVGAEYFFYGTCVYAPSKLTPTQQVAKAMSGGAAATLQAEQYRELVGFGVLPLQGQLINSGETVKQFVIGILKPHYFDMTSIAVYVVLARPTLHLNKARRFRAVKRVTTEPATPPSGPCTDLKPDGPTSSTNASADVTYASAIDDNSWLHWLVRGRQYLRIHYSTDPGHPVTIGVSSHVDKAASPAYNSTMSRLYGVTYDVARAGVVLPGAGSQRDLRYGGSFSVRSERRAPPVRSHPTRSRRQS